MALIHICLRYVVIMQQHLWLKNMAPPFNNKLLFSSSGYVLTPAWINLSGSAQVSGYSSGSLFSCSVQPMGTGESLKYGRINTDILYNVYVPNVPPTTFNTTQYFVYNNKNYEIIEVSDQISKGYVTKIVVVDRGI